MSDAGAYRDEMARLSKLDDGDLDRILSGRVPADAPDPAKDLDAFVRSLRDACTGPPPEAVERRHLAAIMEASRTLADRGERSRRPVRSARERAAPAPGRPTPRRKLMPAGLFASLTARITGVALAAAVATGGLAAAGALPDPAQEAVSDALGVIGIHVPGADGDEHEFSPAPLEEGSTASEHASETATSVLTVVDG
ncbi:MAG TPA: hypothetical protein VE669_05015, partial [Actinomycetota bacterium]|nr:hypothetical protein [Actinomycetota bacterium]